MPHPLFLSTPFNSFMWSCTIWARTNRRKVHLQRQQQCWPSPVPTPHHQNPPPYKAWRFSPPSLFFSSILRFLLPHTHSQALISLTRFICLFKICAWTFVSFLLQMSLTLRRWVFVFCAFTSQLHVVVSLSFLCQICSSSVREPDHSLLVFSTLSKNYLQAHSF